MELEQRLGTMLGENVRSLPVPVAVIVAEARRRGHRRRLWLRLVRSAVTVTAAAGLVWGSTLINVRPDTVSPAAARPAEASGDTVLRTLAGLLPPGASLRQVALPADTEATDGLSLAYENGHGQVSVTLTFYNPASPADRPSCEHRFDCRIKQVVGGGEEVTDVRSSPAADDYDIWETQPDGSRIRLSVHRDTTVTSSLTLDQWQEIARNPHWQISMQLY